MTWQEEIAKLRRELRDRITWAVNSIFVFTKVANTTALGDSDSVTLADDDPTNGQRPARRIEPFGFRSRPVAKQRSLAIKLGSSTVFYLGIASDGGYGPGDLNDGETALYCKAKGTEVLLGENGNVAIAAASGQDVAVNGGTAEVARVGDTLTSSTELAAWALVVETFVNGVAPGTFTPANSFAGTLKTSGALGAIATGAPNFKG